MSMAPPVPIYLTRSPPPEVVFSVCTLVASDERYQRLLASLAARGFTAENTELIALDNRGVNRFEGYGGLRAAFLQCRGEYILYTHDDIELLEDGYEDLRGVLRDLDGRDPLWMVAGNSGFTRTGPERLLRHLSDPHAVVRAVTEPVEVQTLDENFLIFSRARMVLPSVDLSGFHLFAADLCLQAQLAGGRAYVVPFFLRHASGGSASAAFEAVRARFEVKYSALQVPARLRNPASTLYFGRYGMILRRSDALRKYLKQKVHRVAVAFGNRYSAVTRGS